MDAYQFTFEENVTMLSALQILEEQCMKRHGFTLREAGAPHRPADTLRPGTANTELFGVYDPANAYSITSTPEQQAADDRARDNRDYDASLPAMSSSYQLAFSGQYKRSTDVSIPETLDDQIGGERVYPTGCEGWSWDQLAPGDRSEGVFPLIRQIDPWDAAAADPRVAEVETAWSECMRQAGYSYGTPDAIADEDRKKQMTPMTSEQLDAQSRHLRTIAPIDAGCRTSSGYAQTRFDVLVEYDRRAIEAHATELTDQRTSMDAQVRRAADVVTAAGW